MANLTGKDLGRYHIIEQLGEGGMAAVYKAFDTRLERFVAIKVITFGQYDKEMFLLRFEREAKALARLSHPNIVKVHDYGEENGLPYLVMEFLPGGTLKSKLGKPMPWTEAIKLILPIAQALDYAHNLNIVHRDVKPANILLNESGQPMLTDFGIAKILEADSQLQLTGAGVGIGTPEYMAPEQGQGLPVDRRADIYALGVVFYELVTGRRPFQADTPMAVVIKHITEPLPRPTTFVPELPTEIENIIFKALSKKPEDRYQDMATFAKALEKMLYQARVDTEQMTIKKDKVSEASVTQTTPQPVFTPPLVQPLSSSPSPAPVPSEIPPPPVKTPSSPHIIPEHYPVSPPPPPAFVPTPSQPAMKVSPEPQEAKGKNLTVWLVIGGIVGGIALIAALCIGAGALLPLLSPSTTATAPIGAITAPAKTQPVIATPTRQTSPTQLSEGPVVASYNETNNALNEDVPDLRFLAEESYSYEERNQVGTKLTYTVTLKEDERALVSYGWCATTREILDNNLSDMQITFAIDDREVDPSIVFGQYSTQESMQCHTRYLLLKDWPIGQYTIIQKTTFVKAVNDGETEFPAGVITTVYRVTVKTAQQIADELKACRNQIISPSLAKLNMKTYYCDTFERERAVPLGKGEDEWNYYKKRIEDGKLIWDMKAKKGFINYDFINTDAPSLDQFGFTAKFRRASGTQNAQYGFVFRYNADKDEFYLFQVDDVPQTYSVYVRIDNDWITLKNSTKSSAIQPDQWNTLSMTARQKRYTFEINGVTVYSLDDSRLKGGITALFAGISNPGESAVFEFDDVLLVAP
jgi:serine/threonine protein kinase